MCAMRIDGGEVGGLVYAHCFSVTTLTAWTIYRSFQRHTTLETNVRRYWEQNTKHLFTSTYVCNRRAIVVILDKTDSRRTTTASVAEPNSQQDPYLEMVSCWSGWQISRGTAPLALGLRLHLSLLLLLARGGLFVLFAAVVPPSYSIKPISIRASA